MLDLAVYSLGDQVSLKSIAQRQDISESYLEQVFSSLRKANLVKSVKGAQGGYILGRDASDITVGDILRVLEGRLSVVDPAEGVSQTDGGIERCLSSNVWEKLNDCINSLADSITLEDLMTEYKKAQGDSSLMFYI
jgi:Rrf2 family protein